MVYIAYFRHSPEDTAIGLGADEEAAMAALIAAYPAAQGKPIEVTACAMGSGLASLEAEPLCGRLPSSAETTSVPGRIPSSTG